VLARLLDTADAKIISTGGGIVIRPENRKLLKEQSLCIWLTADVSILAARCAVSDRRPLLQTGDPVAILEGLLEKRRSWYEDVAIAHVPSHHEDPHVTAAQVLDALAAYLKTNKA